MKKPKSKARQWTWSSRKTWLITFIVDQGWYPAMHADILKRRHSYRADPCDLKQESRISDRWLDASKCHLTFEPLFSKHKLGSWLCLLRAFQCARVDSSFGTDKVILMSCDKTLASVDKPHYLLEVVPQTAGGKKHIVYDKSRFGRRELLPYPSESVFGFSVVHCFRLVLLAQLSWAGTGNVWLSLQHCLIRLSLASADYLRVYWVRIMKCSSQSQIAQCNICQSLQAW